MPLTAEESTTLIELVHKATGSTVQQPVRNEREQWIVEIHMAVAGLYRQLSEPENVRSCPGAFTGSVEYR